MLEAVIIKGESPCNLSGFRSLSLKLASNMLHSDASFSRFMRKLIVDSL